MSSNELVMRISPDESVYMTTTSKVPGLTFIPQSTVMDMSYKKAFKDAYVGDAYERLLLNASLGDQSLFVSADELVEMWRIFTPLLHAIDEQKPDVAIYPFGMVPTGWADWAAANLAQESLAAHALGARPPTPPLQPSPQPPRPSPPTLSTLLPSLASPTDAPSLDKSIPFCVIIFGATGDLARKKLFPALYQLVLLGHLPRALKIVGYGRSKVQLDDFLKKQCVNIKEQPALPKNDFEVSSDPIPPHSTPLHAQQLCAAVVRQVEHPMHFIPCIRRVSHAFQACISFHAGPYDSPESFKLLAQELTALEGGRPSNRLYFLSVPPPVFGAVTAMIDEHARATEPGFTRLMIEKPFGRDSESFEELNQKTASCFHETQLYRLDHYLGKEVILNISTLRWANQVVIRK